MGNSKQSKDFDWQGHRGARGEVPENTVPSLQRALQDGVTTLEMDVVITQDSVVLLSHEPWLSATICLDSTGTELTNNPQAYNIFELPLRQVQQFDCGLKTHPDFPTQEKYSAYKPTLLEAILASEEAAVTMNRNLPLYNIEIKSRPAWEGKFHPDYKTYTDLVLMDLKKAKILQRTTLQSFDVRVLQYLHEKQPSLKLSLLVAASENKAPEQKFKELGFLPAVYSPEASLVNKNLVTSLHAQNIQIIPWTVNEITEAERLMQLGVDGLITDFPGRLIPALGQQEAE
jgi:glycerophosphoryl diester phosphodiesterase